VVDSANDGFDVYEVDGFKFVRQLPTGATRQPLKPRQVAFGESSRTIVCGSNSKSGVVYVFGRNGQLFDELQHPAENGVQIVAVSWTIIYGCSLIFEADRYVGRQGDDRNSVRL